MQIDVSKETHFRVFFRWEGDKIIVKWIYSTKEIDKYEKKIFVSIVTNIRFKYLGEDSPDGQVTFIQIKDKHNYLFC